MSGARQRRCYLDRAPAVYLPQAAEHTPVHQRKLLQFPLSETSQEPAQLQDLLRTESPRGAPQLGGRQGRCE